MIPTLGTVKKAGITYQLLADRSWRVAENGIRQPAAERLLTEQYSGDDWFGPSRGRFGAAPLDDLAANLGGVASYQLPSDPPDTVS